MKRLLCHLVFISVVLFGCGKNDFVPVGSVPVAPYPPQYQVPLPPGQAPGQVPPIGPYNPTFPSSPYSPYPTYPGGGYYPTQPSGYVPGQNFWPQVPTGMPVQYQPFLPIDNYFRRSPQMFSYWQKLWSSWVTYSNVWGINPMNFNRFWFDFCPQQWQGTSYGDGFYQWFDQNFYYWMQPNTQVSVSVNGNFWQNYQGYYFGAVDAGGYCLGCQ